MGFGGRQVPPNRISLSNLLPIRFSPLLIPTQKDTIHLLPHYTDHSSSSHDLQSADLCCPSPPPKHKPVVSEQFLGINSAFCPFIAVSVRHSFADLTLAGQACPQDQRDPCRMRARLQGAGDRQRHERNER